MSKDEAMSAYVDVLLKVRLASFSPRQRSTRARDADYSPSLVLCAQMLKRYKDRQEARDIIYEFRQARAMAQTSSFAGSQEWQGLEESSTFTAAGNGEGMRTDPHFRHFLGTGSYGGSASPSREDRSRETTAFTNISSSSSSSSSNASSSPPAPFPPSLPSLTHSSSTTPRPSHSQPRLFEIPDPSLPPPDLSPPYITAHLPGLEAAPSVSEGDDQPTATQTRAASRVHQSIQPPPYLSSFQGPSLPLPMPAPPATSRSFPTSRARSPPPVRPPLVQSTTSVETQAFSTALERIQASLSGLHERLESLETATLQDDQRSHPLRTLLFPPRSGRQVGVPRLIWTLFKRTATDAVLALTVISVWILLTGQRGMRRSSVREFWASIVQLLWRRSTTTTRQTPAAVSMAFGGRGRGGQRGM